MPFSEEKEQPWGNDWGKALNRGSELPGHTESSGLHQELTVSTHRQQRAH